MNTPTPNTQPIPTPRPAAMGVTCDAWHETGLPDGPRLRRCHRHASAYLVIRTAADCYALKRCPACAEELRAKVRAGATFEILSEVAL